MGQWNKVAEFGASGAAADLTGIYSPVKAARDYGARFDGSNHPLSEGYGSNAAAQAAFPNLTAYLAAAGEAALTTADTYDYAAIMEAIWSLPDKGGIVVLPPGEAKISRGIVAGNGSRTTGSTKNGIQIVGQGIGGIYEPYASEVASRACVIKPIASLSVPLLTFRGRIYGVGLENVVLDATTSYWAPCCFQTYHIINSRFDRVQVRNASQWGIRSEIDNTASYDYWDCDNHWYQISIQSRSTSSGWLFGDSTTPYSQQGDLCRHYIHGLGMSGTSSTQTAIQIGMCDSCWFEHVAIYGYATGKQIVIRPQAAAAAYPENITFKDLMCGGGMNGGAGDPDDFWTIDESLATWTAGDNKITIESLHQESSNPAFPSDARFKGYAKDGTFYNGWGGGAGSNTVRTHYDLTGTTTIAAPVGDPTVQVISLKQDATGGRAVTWNAIYKFTAGFQHALGANKSSIYSFIKAGSEYHLMSAPIIEA